MKKFFVFGLIVLGFGFVACADEYPRSVGYFENNYKIAKDRYKECNKEDRTKRSKNQEKDCENAYSALSKIEKPALREFMDVYGAIKMYFYKFHKFDTDVSSMITQGYEALQQYVAKMNEKKIIDGVANMKIQGHDEKIKINGKNCVEFVVKNELELEISLNRNEEICSIVFDDVMKPDTVLLDKNKRAVGKVIFK